VHCTGTGGIADLQGLDCLEFGQPICYAILIAPSSERSEI